MTKYIIILLLLSTGMLFSCDEALSPKQRTDDIDDYELNAVLMDLYLTNDVSPSFEYYRQLNNDTREIESRYGEEYPRILELEFRFPFNHDELRVVVDDDTRLLIESGEYTAWDSLNMIFAVDTILDYGDYYLLRFNCCSNMKILDDYYYNKLPGVVNTDPNGMLHRYPTTNLFPRAFGDTISYLYSYCGSPDLCGGCAFLEYYYFRSINHRIEYVGCWYSISGNPLPDWWYNEAYLNDWKYYEIYFEPY